MRKFFREISEDWKLILRIQDEIIRILCINHEKTEIEFGSHLKMYKRDSPRPSSTSAILALVLAGKKRERDQGKNNKIFEYSDQMAQEKISHRSH